MKNTLAILFSTLALIAWGVRLGGKRPAGHYSLVEVEALAGFQQEFLAPTIEVGEYLGFVTRILLAFGTVFELPIVIMILSVLGIVTPAFLRRTRRHSFVGITVLASLLTPGDIASTLLMMAPMVVLYGLSIIIAWVVAPRRPSEDT